MDSKACPDHDINNDLVIVVGKGKGSISDPVLRDAVVTFLEECYDVVACIDSCNSGRLVVSSNELEKFIDRQTWR